MGRMVDGRWVTRDLGPDEKGNFVRRAAVFRNLVTTDGSSGFAPARGRYHLYVANACGWSHRTLIVRALKGLRDIVSVSVVEPFMGQEGWTLKPGSDPIHGAEKLYDVYLATRADYTGRASVPVLWDRESEGIVSNDSMDIMRSFDTAFDSLADQSVPPLFDPGRKPEIDEMIGANYGPIQNGVYKCGFAASQQAHEEAARALFARLDALEALLGTRRYLLGDVITAADWCLFPTLYRFDTIYYVHFKCCLRQVRDYPNLWGYLRDLYQVPGVAETCDMQHIREHYFTSHESIHPRRYIPLSPNIAFDEPHGRARDFAS